MGATVTITGTNFDTTPANNTVFFGVTKTAPSAATATQLTVAVPTGASFGPITVQVSNRAAISDAFFLPTYTGVANTITTGTLAQKVDFAAGANTHGAAIGDLDGDGKLDIATSNANGNTVSVFRNTSASGAINTASFAAKVDFATGTIPVRVEVGDLDGDGKLDMIVANGTANTLSVYHNTGSSGTISFATKVDFATGVYPHFIKIDDIDGDGKPDMAVANWGNGSGNTLSVFRNTSVSGSITTASFAAKVDFTTGTGPTDLVIGDLDGDGKPDLVTANRQSGAGTTVSILRNTATAGTINASSFAAKADFSAGTGPYNMALGDLDGDGKLDLAVGHIDSSPVSLFRNTSTSGTISFAATVDITATGNNRGVALGDLDGDGKLDLAVGNHTGSTMSVFLNTGSSGTISFATKVDFTTGSGPVWVAIGDLDGDTKPDVMTSNSGSNSVSVFHNIADPPTITSFTPTSGNVGATVTITGTNFSTTPANNTVFFGATKATVSAATATQLTTTVPTGAIFAPITVQVSNRTAISNPFFLPTFTTPVSSIDASTLASKVDFTSGSAPIGVTIGDLDGDGKPDLAVPNQVSNTVSVFRNTSTSGTIASGSFATKVDFATGSGPNFMAIGDLDGDGKLDMVTQNLSSGNMSILRNTSTSGSVSFATKVDFTQGTQSTGAAIGDLDGDGKPDIVVASLGSNIISVFRNISVSGTIDANSFATKVDFTTGSQPEFPAIGDIDGDGKPDITVANRGSNTVSVFRNTSTSGTITTSSFAAKADFATGTTPFTVGLSDIDGDGKPDVVTPNNGAASLSVLRNTSTSGSVSFATKVDFTTGSAPYGIAIGDIDGDGKTDLVVPNNSSNTVSLFKNTSTSGTISLTAKTDFATATNPQGAAVGDLDGDGKTDVVIANASSASLSVYHNQLFTGTIPTLTSFTPTSGNVGATVTITGTNFDATPANNTVFIGGIKVTPSAATTTQLTITVPDGAKFGPISVTVNNRTAISDARFLPTYSGVAQSITTGTFAQKVDFTTGTDPQIAAIGDLDGDGKTDIALVNFSSSTLSVFRNTSTSGALGASSFATKVDFATGTGPRGLDIGDLDGDGKLDIAVANDQANTVSVFHNTGSSGTISFASKVDFTSGNAPKNVAIDDLDGDGKPDIAIASNNSGSISILRNTSTSGSLTSSSFASKVDFSTGSGPNDVAVGDIDGDGKPDIVAVNSGASNVSIFRNIATSGSITTSSFATKVDFTTGTDPTAAIIGDLDANGKPELIVSNSTSNTVSVFRNTATSGTIDGSTFATKVDFTAAGAPQGISIGDIDGNGKPDITVANQSGTTFSLFHNTSTTGTITLGTKVDFTASSNPSGTVIADFDGDNKPDVAVVNGGTTTLSIFHNIADPPTVASFTPTSGNVGTTITITGTNFDTTPANNTVFFGGIKATVSAATATQLTTTVPTGATFAPISVTVANRTAVSDNPFLPTFTATVSGIDANTLASKVDLTAGSNPLTMAVGDIDGDGKPDLIATNQTAATVSVFRNTSTSGSLTTGSFAAKVDFTTNTQPYSAAVGDLDGDGKLDVVVVNSGATSFSVFRNTSTSGTISLAAKVDFTTGGQPYYAALNDFDGDGKLDIAVNSSSSGQVSVFRNTSVSGTIDANSFATKVDFNGTSGTYYVAAGDIDGDGKPDIAATNLSGDDVSILRNTSTPGTINTSSFATKVDFTTGSSPRQIGLFDLDGDGKRDLAIANRTSNTLSIFRNTSTSGTISLATKVDFTAATNVYGVGIGDIDGDGKPDIVTGNSSVSSISLFHNTSTSGTIDANSLAAKVDFTAGGSPYPAIVSDLDGDGKPDVATANNGSNTVSIFHNQTFTGTIPTLTSFTPTSGNVGTTVTITGTNFDTTPANNTVFFGATKATVSAATATQLTVTVPTHATFAPITVTVANRTTTSGSFFLPTFAGTYPTTDASSFASKVDFATGTNPRRVAIGDVDGDGKPDLAVPNENSNTISVFRNTSTSGTISYAAKVDFTTGTGPTNGIAFGDLDGDGKLDIAIPNLSSNTVSVFRNTSTSGTISYAAKVDLTTGTTPIGVAIDDIDRDGKLDIAIPNNGSSTVSIFRNTSIPGTLSFATKVDFSTTSTPGHATLGDLDGDGKPELLVPNGASNSVSVFRNTATSGTIDASSFAAKVDYTTGDNATHVAVGDLDGDNKPEMAVLNINANTVSVFRNTSTSGTINAGSFAAKVDFIITGTSSRMVAIGDLNGDGKPELVASNSASNSLSVLPNTSTSGTIDANSFAAKVDFTTGTSPLGLAVGDLDGDDKPELISTNSTANTISILRNLNLTTAQPTITSFTPTSGNVGATITITGTNFDTTPANNTVFFGATKATVSAATATQLTVTVPAHATFAPIKVTVSNRTAESDAFFLPTYTGLNQTVNTGILAQKVDFTTGTGPQTVKIADIDGDGKPDLIVPNYSSNTVSVFRNTSTSGVVSTGSFAAKADFTTATGPVEVAVADIDGDGKLDLAISHETSNNVSVLRNTSTSGSVSFATKVDFTAGTGPIGVATGDIDGDGKPDMAVVNKSSTTLSLFRNTSTSGAITTSSFAAKVDFTTGTNPLFVAIGDIDGDGKSDVAVTNFGTSGAGTTVSVFRNTSTSGTITTSSLATKADFTTGAGPEMIGMADLDGDGKLDLAVTVYGNAGAGSTTSILRNTSTSGSVSFATKVDLTTGAGPIGLALGDVDGDGKTDLAAANFGNSGAGSTASVFKNNSTSGSLSFATKVDFTTGAGPQYLALGDLDGDGKTDLAVASTNANALSVFHNIADPPTVTTFTPTSGNVGATVTITGTNFDATPANNTVFFGATKATVSASTATQLTVTVPTGATLAPITVQVGDRKAISNAFFLPKFTAASPTINSGTLSAKTDFATATTPDDVAVGDIDGDGKVDIIVPNQNSSSVSVFHNTGSSGTIAFATKADFTTGGFPSGVVVGDFDNDNKLDLAIASFTSTKVSILRNTSTSGTVSFATKVEFTTSIGPNNVAAGDFDGDGKLDLAVPNLQAANVSVFHNQSTSGTISFAAKTDLATGSGAGYAAIGDIDGDGKPDLLVSNKNANTVSVFRNTSTSGTIAFATKVDIAVASAPLGIKLADIDGDAKLDLIAAKNFGLALGILRNTSTPGTITFATSVDISALNAPYDLEIGDINGDDKPDIALASSTSDKMSLFPNTSTSGTISFGTRADFTTNNDPYDASIADFDGDGKSDVVVVNRTGNNISVYRNETFTGTIPTITSFTPTSGAVGATVTITGTNFDTTPANNTVFFGATKATVSAATATQLTTTVPTSATFAPIRVTVTNRTAVSDAYFLPRYTSPSGGITSTSFASKVDFTTGTGPVETVVGDIDGDGKPDVATTNLSANTISVFRNTSAIGELTSSSFATKVDLTTGTTPRVLALCDLDGDGKPDIASTNAGSNTVSVFHNTSSSGTVSFATKVDFATGTDPSGLALEDVDGDGRPDIAVVNYGSGSGTTVSVLLNTSLSGSITTASFATKQDFTTGTGPDRIAIGDVDGDGKPDLAVTNYNANTASILRNTSTAGSLSFATKVDITPETNPAYVVLGDIDGDGKLDLAIPNNGSNTVSVFRNTSSSGTISFATTVDFTTGTAPRHASLGDIDGDGKLDLAVTNGSSSSVSIFRNTSTSGSITSSSLATKVDVTTGGGPYGVAIADLDGDSKPDLSVAAFSTSKVSVLHNITSLIVTLAPHRHETDGLRNANVSATFSQALAAGTASNFVVYGSFTGKHAGAYGGGGTTTLTFDPTTDFKPGEKTYVTFTPSLGAGKHVYSYKSKAEAGLAIFTDIVGNFGTGSDATSSLAFVDVDADGDLDIATGNNGTQNVVYLNDGTGQMTGGTKNFGGTSGTTSTIAFFDVDGDGDMDATIGNIGTGSGDSHKLYSNDSSGNFSLTSTFGTSNSETRALTYGDIDADGDLDIISGNGGTVASIVNNAITNSGSGSFSTASSIGTTAQNTYALVLGDIDNDGDLDVIEGNLSQQNRIFRNDGSGTFPDANKISFGTGSDVTRALALADIDADGDLDIATGNNGQQNVIYLNDGNSGFAGTNNFGGSSTATWALDFADMDGDGDLDILMGSDGGQNTVCLNVSQNFNNPRNFGTGTDATYAVATADVDGDNDLDIAVGNNAQQNTIAINAQVTKITSFTPTSGNVGTTVTITGTNFDTTPANNTVYFGATKATVTAATTTQLTVTVPSGATFGPITVTVNTLTAESDVFFLPKFTATVSGISTSTFATKVDFSVGTTPRGAAIGDIDGDGKPDLATANSAATTVSVLRNTSTSGTVSAGSFATKVDFTTGTMPYGVSFGDLDGDGKLDMVVANKNDNTVSVYRNTSTSGAITSSSFAAKVDFTTGSSPESIKIGDIDSDGKPDLTVAGFGSAIVSVLKNASTSGTISLAAKVDHTIGSAPLGLALGDIDGDGKPDIVAANNTVNTISVLKNTSTSSTPTFATKVDFATGTSPREIALGDLDGDGKLDLAVANSSAFSMSVFRNTSTSGTIDVNSFATKVDFSAGNGPIGTAIADIDGDGKPDLAFSRFGSNIISLFRNTSTSGSITTSSFASQVDISAGDGPWQMVMSDVDGDGKIDMAATNILGSNTISVFHNQTFTGTLPITETTATTGITGALTASKRQELPIFTIGITGDNSATLTSIALTISDLTTATGLTSSDFHGLKLYKSTNNTLDGNDTLIGKHATVNIGSATTLTPTSTETPPASQQYYLITAVIHESATAGHAFKVGFAANGVTLSIGTAGTSVTASDANKITIQSTSAPSPLLTSSPSTPTTVDFEDYITFASAFGKQSTGAGFNATADFNSDNTIDFADHIVFVRNFNKSDVLDISLLRPIGTGANSVAIPRMDLDSSGNTTDDGIVTGTVSGTSAFTVQIFGKSLAATTIGAVADFDIDVAKIKVTSATQGSGLNTASKKDTSATFLAITAATPAGDGHLGTVTFTPQIDLTGIPVLICLKRFVITDSAGKTDTITVSTVPKIALNGATLTTAINETASAVGLSGAATVTPATGIPVLTIGITGDGIASVISATVTLSDLTTATGLATSDFDKLKLYKSTDATFNFTTDTLIGEQTTINIGSPTTITATTPDVPPNSVQTYYIVVAAPSGNAIPEHAFKSDFAAGGLSTSSGNKGTAVPASDANKATISNIRQTGLIFGPPGATNAIQGTEVPIFTLGLTGDGSATLTSLSLTIADLSTPTGLAAADFTQLKLYRSPDSQLNLGADALIGSQSAINIGTLTTLTPGSTETPPSTQTYYIVSAVIAATAMPNHAFRIDFPASGAATSSGAAGTAITANDANKITILASNAAPVGTPQTLTVNEDTDLTLTLTGTDADNNTLTAIIASLPTNGALYQTSDGTTRGAQITTVPTTVTDSQRRVIYAPPANTSGNGLGNFTFKLNDGTADGADVTATLNIVEINDAPTLTALSALTINEDAAAQTVSLSGITTGGNESQTLTVTATSNNTALIPNPIVTYTSPNATGSLAFTPVANTSGTATITVTVTDNGGTANSGVNAISQSFIVTVTEINDAPALSALNALTINEDATEQTISLSGIATGGETQTLTITATSNNTALIPNPTVLYTSPNATGSLTFTPIANANGTATVTATVTDDGGTSNGGINTVSQTFTVTVTSVEDPPTAVNDNFTLIEDTPTPLDVKENDSDPDGDAILVTAIANINGGTAQINPNDNTVQFSPHHEFSGTGGFTYTLTDAKGNSATATVSITVTAVDDSPIANADAATTNQEQAVSINVLDNDTDAEGGNLSIVSVSTPNNGTTAISGTNVIYTPSTGYFGDDNFTYGVSDGQSTSTGDVSITIIRANRLPQPVDDTITLDAGTNINFDPRANDTDPDGDSLGVTNLTDPQNGRVVTNSDGTVFYQPNDGFNGNDNFTYTIDDGHGGQGTATVNVTIQAPPGTPSAVGDAATTDEDTPVTLSVLSNDDDGAAPPLSLISAANGENGTTTINDDGTLTYTPNLNFNGQDQFGYTISNTTENTASGTVIVTVNPINDPPQAIAFDPLQGIENIPLTLDLTTIIFDPDNTFGELTAEVSAMTDPIVSADIQNGELTLTNGIFTSALGSGSIDLTFTDPGGASATVTIEAIFQSVNDPPIFDLTAFSPADGATGISRNVTLSWIATDPDSEVRYNIRLGEQANILNTIGRDRTATNFSFRTDFGKTHYWQIVATDGKTTITSQVRSFTVRADNQPPTLSRVDASDVTDTSARILFRSDEPSTGSVRFGTQPNLANAQTASKQAVSTLKTQHTIALSGLIAATTYHYQAIAKDAAGNQGTSAIRTFTTQRAPDLTPPVITGPFAEGIGHQTASVRFSTNELTTATITGGSSPITITAPALNHLVTLSNLQPQTAHTITVNATDGANNTSTKTITFTTRAVPDTAPPVFTRRPDFNATHTSATISFELSEPSAVSLTYGPANGATIGTLSAGPDIALTFELTALEPATDYTYNLTATDASGNLFTSSAFDLRTLSAPDITPPVVLEGPASTAIGQTETTLIFKTDEPAFSRIIYDTELSDASPRTALSSDAVTEHTRTLTGLVASTTYTYRIDLIDAAGNAITVSGDAFTTTAAPDITPPIFTASPVATEVGFDRITAQWSTNEASTTEIHAEPVVAAKQTTVAETVTRVVSDPVTDHRILIPGLTPNTIYNITIRSIDAAGNILEGTITDNQTLPEPDILPPQVVTRPFVQKVTDTRVLIIFELNEPADGFIDIDTDPSFNTRQSQGSTDPRLRHEITFTGLTSNTQYYYRMRSTDVSGNGPTTLPEAGRQFTFTTRPAPDTAPPNIIEGPVAISPSQSSVSIKMRFDEPATGRVRFSTDPNALDNAGGPFASSLSDRHQLTLTGLTPNTEYFYRVEGTDGAKNGPTISPTKSFRTQKEVDRRPPSITSRPTAIDLTHDSALITWNTSEPATSEVIVRNGPRVSRAEAVQEHSVLITGLNPNTNYRYEVQSTDAAGNTGRKTRLRFRTRSEPDTTPPNMLEGPFLSYRSDKQITVSLRTDEPTRVEVTVFSPASTLPAVHGSSRSTHHNITVTGLQPGVGYAYRAVATDGAGNQTVAGTLTNFVSKPGVATKYVQPPGGGGSFVTALQPDTQFPVIVNGPTVIAATDNAITIEWSTDESADSGISFGTSDLTSRLEDGADVTAHRVVLTDLTPGTTYQYQVESTDPANNGATQSRVFLAKTALGADETPPQMIQTPKLIYLTERAATLSWTTDEPSDTFIEYGTDSLNIQKAEPDFVTQHQITLTNLTPQTTYQYQISATDEPGNQADPSDIFTFTTEARPDTEPPALSGPIEIGRITESSATIIWATSELSDSAVKYSTNADALDLVAGSAADVIAHEVILTNLLPATAYTFIIESTDRSDNGPVTSEKIAFTTTAGKDETPPASPQNLIARGGFGEVALTWTPVPDTDLAGYDILRDPGDGTFTPIATQITDPLFRDTGLDSTTTYRYQIRAVDRADNFGDLSTLATATPNGSGLPTAPTPQDPDGTTLTVQNPQSTIPLTYTFQIATDETFKTLIAQISDLPQGDRTTSYQIDTTLEDGKTYYWRSRTFDGVFFSPYSPIASFTPGSAPNPGDFDGDGTVGFPDFILFASAFGTQQSDTNYSTLADMNADGQVGFPDFILFANVFGTVY